MLFAQNLVEHGSLDSFASSMQRSSDSVGSWLSNITPTTWVIAAVIVIVFVLWSRR